MMYCETQVVASFLGRANYLKKKAADEYNPYLVILIDKQEDQIHGSEIRLKSCLQESPTEEVAVEKTGIFRQYDPPEYLGFPKRKL